MKYPNPVNHTWGLEQWRPDKVLDCTGKLSVSSLNIAQGGNSESHFMDY